MGIPIPVWVLFFISVLLMLTTRKPKLAKSQEDNPEVVAAYQRKLAARSGFFLPRPLVWLILAMSVVLLLMFIYQGITTHQAPPANPNTTEVVVPNGEPVQVAPAEPTATPLNLPSDNVPPLQIEPTQEPIIKP